MSDIVDLRTRRATMSCLPCEDCGGILFRITLDDDGDVIGWVCDGCGADYHIEEEIA